MIYYRKNTDPEMPLPEDFDILFFGESGGRKKSKKTVKLIAVTPLTVFRKPLMTLQPKWKQRKVSLSR